MQTNTTRIIRRKAAAELLGISTATLHRLVRAGELPAPIHLSKQARGWREADLVAFIERRAGGAA